MKRGLRIGLLLLVIILLISGGLFLIKQKKKELGQATPYGEQPRPVTVVTAKKGDLHIEKAYLAVVEPFEEARISARVTAEVKQVLVDEGDRVKAGSVLAKLDAEEIEHRIASAEAGIEQARADVRANRAAVEALETSSAFWQAEKERDRTLADKGAISPVQAEKTAEKAADIKGKLAAARQKSRAIQKQIEARQQQKAELVSRRSYYTLTSPFSGRVSERMTDAGDMAAPGRNLLVIQNQDRLKISFDVPQKDLPEVNKGKKVTFSAGGHTRKTPISVMYPALDKAKMMRAEAWPEPAAAAGLMSGAYVPVTVSIKKLENVILVPESALIAGPEAKGHVFAVIKDRLTAKPVEMLGRTGNRIAVKGIDAGTRVVENTYLGWAVLSSGQKVAVVQ
ncbi:MAG: efflux RND transporter periplasmic adaptor subunit [Desulfobacterales bacterium]|nr:efflux RND transporter periplasmic adaptor subunit [Desulfobacterales bacterium]